jgi:hypothetical protein
MARVLINLRIPSLTLKHEVDAPRRVDNSMLRFLKTVEVPAIPKVGDTLSLTADALPTPFPCTVKRSDWDDRENMFVVACAYGKTSIPEADYRALVGSPDWVSKSLL